MTYLPRILLFALASFGAANVLGSLLCCASRRSSRTVTTRGSVGEQTASNIFARRARPIVCACAAGTLALAALVQFEPRDTDERAGAVVLIAAAIGAAAALVGMARWIRALGAQRRVIREWLSSAEQMVVPGTTVRVYVVDVAFPLVAVVGLARQRVVVARRVLDSCTAPELRAILAHEAYHCAHRHNLRRGIMAAMPDVLAWLPAARQMARDWHLAAEREADRFAAGGSAAGALDLAAALIRVARLATGTTPLAMPGSAFYRGEDISVRVRRVLAPPHAPATRRKYFLTPIVAGAALLAVMMLRPIHALVEAAVAYLP